MSEVEGAATPVASEGNASASIPQQVQVVEPAKKSIEETMAEAYDKVNPPRDQQQRFAAKDKPEEEVKAVEETPAEETTETEGQTQEAAPSEPEKPAITYPTSLPAELREKLDQAAPELRDWVAKREAESHKRITELGQAAKASEPIRQIADRYKASFKGMNAPEAFEKLAAANAFLEQDPVAGIQWLADAYGVQLPSLGKPSEGEGNPEVAQLRQTISQLQRQMAETSNKVTSREQAEQQASEKSIGKLVEDFAKDKPYWGELEQDVLQQIHAIQATDANLAPEKILDRAYDRATKLNESVQAKIAADKKAEADKKAKAEAAKKAADAKKSASVNVKSGQGASPKPSGSWEQTMRDTADRLMGN
jgi:colicin import membrane protein